MGTVVAVGRGVAVGGAGTGVAVGGPDVAVGAGATAVGTVVAAGAGTFVAVPPEAAGTLTTGMSVGSGSLPEVQASAIEAAAAINNNRRRPDTVRFLDWAFTILEAT